MAFKRYIHKHGKKLGPYYYENVRSNDGRVKSVYLGTNPGHHPRHRIRKPLFFLILMLILILILGGSLFLLQNKSYLVGKVRQQDPGFEVDQILLKVLIRSTEFIEKEIRVMNTGSEPANIAIEVSGLSDIVSIDSSSFTIKPGQTKTVKLNFSSIIPASNIEQQPGVYVGKLIARSEKGSRDIPMVAEIETKNVLFDMNLNPVALERKVKQGTDTTIEVRLFNLESIESVNVDVEYFVKDINGNTIITESETVVAKTQASFFKTISIPRNLKPGPYIFAAKSRFGNSIGTASYLFEVTGPEQDGSFVQFCKNSILCLGLSFTTILLLFALTAYFYFFIGAYLYEKVTGASVVQKRKEKEEPGREGFFARLRGNIAAWKQRRLRRKAEEGQLQRKQELLEIEAEQRAEQEGRRKHLEEERKETEQKRKEQLERQKSLEQKGAIETKGKNGFAGLLHKIGILKTPEEKKQAELLNEKARQQKLREEQEYKRQQELEARRMEGLQKGRQQEEERQRKLQIEAERKKAEEKKREELESERKRLEEARRQEEFKKQKEIERQKALEEKKRLEEEKNREAEQEKRQKEIERQEQEQLKAQKLEAIKQIEEKLRKNKEASEQLMDELKKAEQEKRSLTSADNDIEARIKGLDHEILEKARHNEELSMQKNSIFEKYQNQLNELAKKRESQKAERDAKIKEIRASLAEKQNALVKELENELSKLSPQKRKSTEKWKRLEIKAKMKLEEQNVEEEIKKYGTGSEENKAIDESYKKSVEELGKKQVELKQAISQLESRKQKILLEKKNIPRDIESKENELRSLLARLETSAKERESLSAELSKLKSELSGFNTGFLKRLVTGYRENAEKARREKERERARLEAEKRREEEAARKEKELEEKSKRIEDERKKKEEERAAKEEQKRKALEEKLKSQDEKKKQKEAGKQAAPGEGQKKPGKQKIRGQEGIAEKGWLGLFNKEPKTGFQEEKNIEEKAAEPEEEKPGVFARLFGKKKKKMEEAAEEAPEQIKKSKPKNEAEELEEAIKSLDLFKKIEEGRSIKEKGPSLGKLSAGEPEKEKKGIFGKLFARKEKRETEIKEKPAHRMPVTEKLKKEGAKAGKKAIGSKAFEKCHKMLDDAKDAAAKNDAAKAKKLYIEVRGIYVKLDYKEKKEIYGDLMDLYNKLK
ncbi:hypothetical protein HYX08_05630 [Candidatus Woesearchaeota archaeon]|nr:hypothetical protein [Candidatus Woesearchaeota archaeon]